MWFAVSINCAILLKLRNASQAERDFNWQPVPSAESPSLIYILFDGVIALFITHLNCFYVVTDVSLGKALTTKRKWVYCEVIVQVGFASSF